MFGGPCLYSPSGHSLTCLPALGDPCLSPFSGHKSDNGCVKHRLTVLFSLIKDSSVSSRMVRALQRGCHCPTCAPLEELHQVKASGVISPWEEVIQPPLARAKDLPLTWFQHEMPSIVEVQAICPFFAYSP